MTALISTKSPLTSFATVHLDGRLDWIIAQRSALLAWSGHGLHITPRVNSRMVVIPTAWVSKGRKLMGTEHSPLGNYTRHRTRFNGSRGERTNLPDQSESGRGICGSS